jgi:hypothetical protein
VPLQRSYVIQWTHLYWFDILVSSSIVRLRLLATSVKTCQVLRVLHVIAIWACFLPLLGPIHIQEYVRVRFMAIPRLSYPWDRYVRPL